MTRQSSDKPVALITGASSGLGEAVARKFAQDGFRIVAVARRKDRLDQLAKELSAMTDVEVCAVDVTHKDAADRAVEAAMKRFGRLDCLVNNAGSFKHGAVGDVDDALLDEAIELSLKAPFRFCRAAVRVMKPGSSIVTVGSTWGVLGAGAGGSYCMVKTGLVGLTRSLAADYGPKGIRANLVAPGVIKTDMTKDFWDEAFFRRLNHEMTPFNREGTSEDVANTIYFLASHAGSYINGQTIALDGGWSTTKILNEEALFAKRAAE